MTTKEHYSERKLFSSSHIEHLVDTKGFVVMLVPQHQRELVDFANSSEGVCVFRDVREFLDWMRIRSHSLAETIDYDVSIALEQISFDLQTASPALFEILTVLKRHVRTPSITEMKQVMGSRSTLYRIWCDFPEPPSRFLSRVRLSHAMRLIEREGLPPKTAAMRAGYTSVEVFRRRLYARRAEC